MPSLRARFFRFILRRYFASLSADSDVQDARNTFESTASRLRLPGGVQVRHATVAGIDCDWLVPDGCEQAPALLYLHGGAYLMGSSRTHRRLVADIGKAGKVRAVLPNYRLAPEHPYPAAVDDAVAVYEALISEGEQPARLAIGGDSAGGGLTMATLLRLRDAGRPLPAATLLLSPWLDLTASGDTMETRADTDPLFRAADIPTVAAYYCPPEQQREPYASPVFADFAGMPPAYIQVGDDELLLSDSERLAAGLKAAGVPVDCEVWPHMWHVFQFFTGQMPEADRAVAALGAYLRKSFGNT